MKFPTTREAIRKARLKVDGGDVVDDVPGDAAPAPAGDSDIDTELNGDDTVRTKKKGK